MDPLNPDDKEEGPEAKTEAKISKCFHLYNCDNTYKFDSVEKLLGSIKEKLNFDISIAQHYFHLREMSEACERINSEPQMDFAIFVVHAHESRLSINEDNAGIGYAKIYRALLQKTGELLDDIFFSERLLLQKMTTKHQCRRALISGSSFFLKPLFLVHIEINSFKTKIYSFYKMKGGNFKGGSVYLQSF